MKSKEELKRLNSLASCLTVMVNESLIEKDQFETVKKEKFFTVIRGRNGGKKSPICALGNFEQTKSFLSGYMAGFIYCYLNNKKTKGKKNAGKRNPK